ncbi:MAG TPA: LysR substrate-binding domain-containing protein [Amycolatopsis sp.]|uniref:LysR family transcriptional regulator n=1 Tax=Amycolatopsis sp. TaxID=37632 RepID=UPI002B4784E9|nr:LysR substrate-binding domain-containing protein [Amycolatopsis sp.]HKS44162.1 LysR substrate-binding domain-containing protein [Amycolatopsis sp.]
MDLRALECFLAVAEEGSVSRAAAALHMTQPPLSVRLQALERELGVPLLVRHGRGVDLTAAGRVLTERARRLFSELNTTTEMVRTVGLGTRGPLSIAVGHTVSPRLLPHLIGDTMLEPEVDLVLAEGSDLDVVERVHRRDAHAGLLHLEPGGLGRTRHAASRARGLEVAVVAREPLVAVLAETHPGAAQERIDLAEVGGERVVVAAETGQGFAAHVRAAWEGAGRSGAVRHEATSVIHALALVEAGAGVTLLPAQYSSMVWQGLTARPLRRHTAVVETAVCWRPDDDSPVLRRFLRTALSTPEPDMLGPEHARNGPGAAHW